MVQVIRDYGEERFAKRSACRDRRRAPCSTAHAHGGSLHRSSRTRCARERAASRNPHVPGDSACTQRRARRDRVAALARPLPCSSPVAGWLRHHVPFPSRIRSSSAQQAEAQGDPIYAGSEIFRPHARPRIEGEGRVDPFTRARPRSAQSAPRRSAVLRVSREGGRMTGLILGGADRGDPPLRVRHRRDLGA